MKAFRSDIPAVFHEGPVAAGTIVELDPDEVRHVRAFRLAVGDDLLLLDGAGRTSRCTIHEAEKRRCAVMVRDTVLEEPEQGLYIGLIVGALSDKTRLEWLVEKGVELGVREIVPLRSDRAEGFAKVDRLKRVAVAALKQSQRAFLPDIAGQTEWEDVLERLTGYDTVLMLHEQGEGRTPLREMLRDIGKSDRVALLVGPEGGFDEREIELVRARVGAVLVSLGEARLRAETAGISAVAVLSLVAG